jgi:putative ABC transport system ATP-binding protein
VLELKNISKIYVKDSHEIRALDDVSLMINDGDFMALKGPSGSGKTSLLNILGLVDIPDTGEYILDGINIGKLSAKERLQCRKRSLGFVFQNYNLIPELTVYENVEIPLLIQGTDKKIRKEKVENAVANVGLLDYLRHKPGELSGGQQQRVSIARALVRRPPLIIADEPTANLDSENGRQIVSLMRQMNEKYGITFVFATHDEMILEYMKQIVYLRDGKITDVTVKNEE